MSGIIKCFNNYCVAFDTKEVDNCCKPLTKIQECADSLVCYDDAIKPSRYYIRILSDKSCQCRREKKVGIAFCFTCWRSLSLGAQKAVYRKLGNGFEQAYETALKELK